MATTKHDSRTPPGDDKRRRLDGLTPRQRLTGAQAAARSQLIGRLRIALPLLAVVLIGALLFNTRTSGVDSAFLDDFANLEATPEELRMASPRFAGVDDKGFPYEITAEEALQAPGVQERVNLVRPRAVTRKSNEETTVIAGRGVYQTESNILELHDEVTLEHMIGGDAFVLRTPTATVSIRDEIVRSAAGVDGEGESGTLRADRMHAYNSEGRVVFEGNVSMRIYPKKTNMGAQPDADRATDRGEP